MSNKVILLLVIAIASLYGCTWLFNHINAWIGIGTFLVLILTTNLIINKIKKDEKTN